MNTGTGPENTQNRPRLSVRFRLVSLILACVVPLGIAACLLVYTVYQEKRQDISRNLLETTRTFSMIMDREQDEIKTALQVLATSPYLATGDFTGFHAQALKVLTNYPDTDIILADATGQQLVNSYLPPGSPLPKRNVPDRVKGLFESGKPSVSGLFKGAITGRHLISVDVPVIRDGKVAYDLAMTLPVDKLINVLNLPQLPPEWTATILDNSNTVVARANDQFKSLGIKVEMPVLERHREQSPEGVIQAAGLAGVPVLAGYSQSAVSGWTMVVSVPERVVMRDLWRWLSWALGGTVLLGSLGVVIALRLGNKIATSVKTLSAQATALGLGGTAQAGPIEFNEAVEVAQSLAKAKDLLAQREDALRESKAEAERRATLLNATLDSIAEGLIVLGPDRSVVRLNSFAAQAFPFLREGEVISDEKWPISMSVTTEDGLPIQPDSIPGFRALAGETVTGEMLRFTYQGGPPSWASVNAAPIRNAEGGITGAIVTFQDLTERKRVREALRESQERYRTIVQTASEGFWTLDQDGLTTYVNATMAQMLDCSPEDMVGRHPRDFLFPEDHEDHEDRKREHRMGISSRYERRLRKKGGGEAWFIASTAPLVDSDGEYIGSFAMFTDITERKRAEKALIESEKRYRTVVQTASEGILILDQDDTISQCNQVMAEMLGCTPEEAIGRPGNDFLFPEDLEDHEARKRERREGKSGRYERRLRKKDGGEAWFITSATPLMGPDGTFLGSFAMFTDITDRMHAEESIKQSQGTLEATLNGLSANIALLDEHGVIILVNKAWRKFASQNGISPQAVSEGANYLQVCDNATGENSKEAAAFAQGLRSVLSGEKDFFRLEYPCDSPEVKRWFLGRVTSFSGGPFRRIIVSHDDITERKHMEDSLRKQQMMLARTESIAQIGSWEWDVNTDTVIWSDETFRIFKIDPANGTPPFAKQQDLYHPDDLLKLKNAIEHTLQHGEPFELELRVIRSDNEIRHCLGSGYLDTNSPKSAPRLVGSLQDITERKRAEQFRSDVERIIRHDIKAPLTGLHSLAQYTLGEDVLDDEMKALVPGLLHSINHVIKLVDSSEKIIQMEHGGYEPKSGNFNLRDVMFDLELSLRSLLAARRVTLVQAGMLDSAVPSGKPVMFGEEFLIEDMLMNLVKNAVEASPEGRAVTVTFSCMPDKQFISIHNHGVVPEEIRNRFFEKYATYGKIRGKGLGTYSAQLIAKAHGGHIEFTSSVTDGTTVTVILPAPSSQS